MTHPWMWAILLLSSGIWAKPIVTVEGEQTEQQSHCFKGIKQSDNCSQFRVQLPQYNSAWLNQKIQHDTRQSLGDKTRHHTQSLRQLLQAAARHHTGISNGYVYTQQVNITIKPQGANERWAAYTLIHDEYNKGAAHGSTVLLERVWDVQAKKPVALTDILINSQAQKRLFQLAYDAAMADFVHDGDLSEDEAKAQLDGEMFHFQLTHNWRPVKGGLVLVYQQYEIAPYAYGTPTLFISAEDLSDIVKPAFLAYLQHWPVTRSEIGVKD